MIQTNAKFPTYIIQLVYSSILHNEMKEKKEVSLSNHTMANDTTQIKHTNLRTFHQIMSATNAKLK